ncbi:MAG: hypothetical protein AAGD12_11085 [Pseudomonadota bacterium]
MLRLSLILAAAAALSGCAGAVVGPDLGGYNIGQSDDVRSADWPRLIDIPDPPAPGTFTAAVPDPAEGAAAEARLRAAASRMRARADALAEPVLSAADRRRLTGRPTHRQTPPDPAR